MKARGPQGSDSSDSTARGPQHQPAVSDPNVALAEWLRDAGVLAADQLRDCLQEAKATLGSGRGHELTLAVILLERGLVPPAALEMAVEQILGSASLETRAEPEGRLRASRAGSDTPAAPARRFGPYRVVGVLGQGGMGVVYEVEEERTGIHYALKSFGQLQGRRDEQSEQRERVEAEALGRLRHPGVVAVHAADLEAPEPYLVQELLTGGSLKERLAEFTRAPVARSIELALELAKALQHAHQRGVLHRDLKPANVLFDEEGRARLADFGLARLLGSGARLTATGQIMGTPGYMAPEQALGEQTDERTDVYGLGALLYAALSGRAPFVGKSIWGLLRKLLEEEPDPIRELRPDVSLEVAQAVMGALAKKPEDRPASVEEFAEALRGVGEACQPPSRVLHTSGLLVSLTLVVAGVWAATTAGTGMGGKSADAGGREGGQSSAPRQVPSGEERGNSKPASSPDRLYLPSFWDADRIRQVWFASGEGGFQLVLALLTSGRIELWRPYPAQEEADKAQAILGWDAAHTGLGISPQDDCFVYFSREKESQAVYLNRVDLPQGNLTPFRYPTASQLDVQPPLNPAADTLHLRLSPRGEWVAVWSREQPGLHLFRLRAGGAEPVQLPQPTGKKLHLIGDVRFSEQEGAGMRVYVAWRFEEGQGTNYLAGYQLGHTSAQQVWEGAGFWGPPPRRLLIVPTPSGPAVVVGCDNDGGQVFVFPAGTPPPGQGLASSQATRLVSSKPTLESRARAQGVAVEEVLSGAHEERVVDLVWVGDSATGRLYSAAYRKRRAGRGKGGLEVARWNLDLGKPAEHKEERRWRIETGDRHPTMDLSWGGEYLLLQSYSDEKDRGRVRLYAEIYTPKALGSLKSDLLR